MARDPSVAFPGIDRTPGVYGDACVARTRIPVWVLVRARQAGIGEADLLAAYPDLGAEDLLNAWAYADAHHEEIEEHIRQNE